MKHKTLALACLLGSLTLTNCATPPGPATQRTAAAGAATGALLGGVIGHQSGNGWEGAALGALAGGALGGLYGNEQDRIRQGNTYQTPANPTQPTQYSPYGY